MATVTWVCPDDECEIRRDRAGLCPEHLVELAREEPPEPATEPVLPDLALDCHWGQIVDIPPEGLEIGRTSPAFRGGGIESCDQVSRKHARLSWRDGHLYVEDLESANGTFVDGVQLTRGESRELAAGQELRLALDVPCRIVRLNEFGDPL